ncbi:type ISP restriction/modification enzyme [Hirschia litorea]|uniref:site-specific DNA-methyltransferase (adenine-specific) n=1 Tax=Hirschia litorea TaxID=1199156 RepID=A0ABW2IHG7_9PROT
MDSTINRIGLGETVNDKIEVIAVSNHLPNQTKPKAEKTGIGGGSENDGEGEPTLTTETEEPEQYNLWVDEFAAGIMAKIVKKCGRRDYWEDWAKDIADIARKHILRINTIIKSGETSIKMAFDAFVAELRDDLNPEISNDDAIEMLAQHIITKPVFDALFEGNEFTAKNPVSRAMTQVVDVLNEHSLENESESLQKFYESVRRRSQGLKTAEARQKLVVELYDKFFRTAFPAMTQKLGIVYTPVEVVDFIIHSVNDVLQSEFGQTLGSKGVHILDPFTGTGTFITRLLQSGLIKPEELEHKYKHEIHANEIVLLAYYIAAINIEAVYHDQIKQNANGEDVPYSPFEGICLTDTFQLYEQEKDMIADLMPDNSERRTVQKERDIRVIMGNPPYSAGQRSANDDAANIEYKNLDAAIRESYAAYSTATNKNALYDSYIRSIRWATDRIKDTGTAAGVVAYVSNAGWVDGSATDGLRKCLAEEFSSLYVFYLRGNQRTSGELSRKEGGKIFGSGSRSPIAITVLVRSPEAAEFGKIHYYDIGDYLDQKEKLGIVRTLKSIDGLASTKGWTMIEPDENFDWVGQGEKAFGGFLEIGNKKDKSAKVVFETYSRGVATGRDSWCYNASSQILATNLKGLLNEYHSQMDRIEPTSDADFEEKIAYDQKKISWNRSLKQQFGKGKRLRFEGSSLTIASYRPFEKSPMYFSRSLNDMIYLMPRFFPIGMDFRNRLLCVTGIGSTAGASVLMVDQVPDLNMLAAGAQCFPLKIYEPANTDDDLFTTGETGYIERDGISDAGLKHFQTAYAGEQISKEDLFYYIYGLLHSPDYRERFKNNLSKELPRIPAVKTAADFWAFSKAGRLLGDLHVNYESVEPYPIQIAQGDLRLANIDDPKTFFRVEKMKFGGKGKAKDKTTVIYNARITMTCIPLEAYDYVVNGKPALDWVMERQCVKKDKASGIINDANDYANETVGNPAYPLELFQRVITVSLETMKIVNALPKLELPDS